MFPCLCTKLQNAKAVIFLSSTVNTADTGRGGKTCRKDQGISEGPGNTTGGIWISGARRCWGILTDLTVKNVFFFLLFFDWFDQTGGYQSYSEGIHILKHPYKMDSLFLLQTPNAFIHFPFLLQAPACTHPSPVLSNCFCSPPSHRAPEMPMQAWWCFRPPSCHPCHWDNSCQRRMGDEDVL